MSRAARSALAAAATAAVLVLGGCGPAARPHGVVTGKEYEAARTTWHTVPVTKRVCTTTTRRSGKTTSTRRSCRSVTTGHRQVADHKPACWQLELDSGDEVCVSAHTWHTTAIGDHY